MDNHSRCIEMIRRINEELSWQLGDQAQANYAMRLRLHIPEECADDQLRRIVINYHLDHDLVIALQDRQNQRHEAAWNAWITQVIPILRKARLDWSSDMLFDNEDLAQIARTELALSVTKFHYASRFSTWAHKVIVQSVKRAIRDTQALKRAVRPDSLEQLPYVGTPIADAEHPEAAAATHLLIEQIAAILEEKADKRLAHIFQLWVVADLRVEQIGKLARLHPSRVRALLLQARQILRDAPEIQSWREDDSDHDRTTEAK